MSRKSLWLLTLLILTGTFLRLFKFDHTLLLESDQAMAFLLANRIINFGHILLVGPNTSFYGVNILPPTYYYIVTLIYFFWRSELGVSLAFTFIGIMSIPLIFLLAKEMALSAKTALIAAFFYTFSFTLIKYSRNIWEPHFVPFFVIIALYFAHKALNRKNFPLLLLSIFLFFISLMYVSSFLILPAFFFLTYSVLIKIDSDSTPPFLINFYIYILFFALFYFPNISFELTNNFPSLNPMRDFPVSESGNYLRNINTQFSVFLHSFLPINTGPVFATIIIFLLFITIPYLRKNLHLKWISYTLISAILLIGIYQRDAYPHRWSAIYPLFILLVSYFFSQFPKFVIFPFMFIFIYSNFNYYRFYISTNKSDEIKSSVEIAEFILKDSGGKSFSIFTDTPYNHTNYNTVYYVFLMEKLAGKPLYLLHPSGNWIDAGLNTNNRNIYLICEDYSINYFETLCQNKFIMEYNFGQPQETAFYIKKKTIYKFRGLGN
ncbi:hypothetical protein A3J20_02455 [Candidatus Gottesmanbacteria bacterium RIFCSPLOWO2_02_FULL_42_29]|uniref:Glycosyltransferase RgtA/B/C/D-like domain-containing protein n=1 Tax=Candidatus Gottesmanbacteria bacterium RIFCSPLOWO2_01_FULL_42_22 TaxID=1798391 RepID=A0A1F6BB30_9BACT|nr:MAG: hypothetical protein A2781_04010 [Candidatus Gottesmanbacteria bacterium RIFCSPHIGHO2_01_FULL_42_27]OGG34144.1 MAG: hypothetical protein A2968_03145 [Candidatus Gottesmanbacteria bacterium RIFCSPLOWO2_01_FULL_42_22]OGG34402.1 MAG: hypothetical protein A3G68_03730 [Candidatus Gottesmanbacteria bacterium RIFCSPLOWO2_12_FULL_42_10]OGG37920.1 MAG: hypothetical protein A3J20_02455 [Candidatus Gottesmanbacteria bacterium RIFCSPLOWO2_02_FULL_42_29]